MPKDPPGPRGGSPLAVCHPEGADSRPVVLVSAIARRRNMAFNFFRRGRSAKENALGERLPPGQYATEKWPVLHYGSVPKFDQANWDFRISGLVEEPVRLTYDEFMALPKKTVTRDVHCVTRWSMFDSEWDGVP